MAKFVNKLRKNLNRLMTLGFAFAKYPPSTTALIIKDDGIGDFLLFSGAMRHYNEFFRKNDHKVVLIVSKETCEIARMLFPDVDILPLDKFKYYHSLKYRREFLRFLHQVISPSVLVSSIHRSSLCDDIARFSGKTPEKIGYEGEIYLRSRRRFPYNVMVSSYDRVKKPPSGEFNHVVFHELHFLKAITGKPFNLSQVLPWMPSVQPRPRLDLENYFVLVPGAGDFKRVLPLEKQVEIVKRIVSETGFRCVIVGGRKEVRFSKAIQQRAGAGVFNLAGTLSLTQAVLLISRARLVVGMETGLVHSAWILNVPTVMVYGGGHFGRFLPLYSAGKVVYRKMRCFGCNWKCIYPDVPFRCISSIKASEVAEKALSLL